MPIKTKQLDKNIPASPARFAGAIARRAGGPKLRFPGFSGEPSSAKATAGNWEEKRLDEVATIERGKFTPRPRNNPKYYGGEIPFVQTSDIVNPSALTAITLLIAESNPSKKDQMIALVTTLLSVKIR